MAEFEGGLDLDTGNVGDAMGDLMGEAPASEEAADAGMETGAEGAEAPDDVDLTDLGDDAEATEPEADAAPPVEAKPKEAATEEVLPEGVKVRESRGKKYWVAPEDVAKSHYASHERVQRAEELIGEELTDEALQERQNAHLDLDTMTTDLLSGKPDTQSRLFHWMLTEADQAMEQGKVTNDPIETLIPAMLSKLAERRPKLLQQMGSNILADRIEDAYADAKFRMQDPRATEAERNEAKKDFASAQRMDRLHSGSFKKNDQIEAKRMNSEPAMRPVERRESASATDTRGFDAWKRKSSETYTARVHSVIDVALKPHEDAIKSLPENERVENMETLRLRFTDKIRRAIQLDTGWQQQNNNLRERARIASSEQVREQINQQIAQRYERKARAIVAQSKGSILSSNAHGLAAKSTAQHERRGQAASRTGSQGGAAPPKPSLPDPKQNGSLDRESWNKEVDRLFQ